MPNPSKPFIVVATPCFGGVVTQSYMMAILQLMQRAERAGFDLDVVMLGGDALISRARSVLVARFLDNPRATHMLFVDADISFDSEQVLRLLRADKDFVAGQYPLKQIVWQAIPARFVRGEPLAGAGLSYVGEICSGAELRVDDGFATAQYAGTGFQLIKREVLERMIEAYPELKFNAIDTLTNEMPSRDRLCALFDCMIEPVSGTYLSEDYSFCRRWRAIGGEIWLDLRSKLTHSGVQQFDGDCTARFASIAAAPDASTMADARAA